MTALPLGLIAGVTQAALRAPGRFLLGASVLASVSVWLASGLEVRSSFEELLPSDVPSVVHVKELIRRVGGDGTVLVVIETLDSAPGLEPAERLAADLAKELMSLEPSTIRSVEWNTQQIESWYADYWPMFLSFGELEKARDTLRREIGKAKAKANPLLLHLEDEAPAPALSSEALPWLDPARPLPREQIQARFARYRDGFLVHPDGRSLTLVVRPAGTALGVHDARKLLNRMRAMVNTHHLQLQANHLRVGFAGTFPLFVAEYEAILNDVASTAAICLSLVLASLFLFFRELRSTLALGLAVMGAVAVTFGLTRLVIGYLNTQTAFLGAIVVGNGINYGLIYLARVRQLRRAGVPLDSACIDGARTSARATLVASAASSVSFGVLVIAANRGFRHFGFIGGIGMLLCWVFTFTLVPALLAVFERIRPLRFHSGARPVQENVPPLLRRLFSFPRAIAIAFGLMSAVAVVAFLRHLPQTLERNLSNLTNELRGEDQLLRDNALAQASLGKSIAGALALLSSQAEAEEFCEVIRRRQAEPRWSKLIESCESISSVLPNQQPQKLSIIADIQRQLSDLVLEHLPPEQANRLRQVKSQLAAQRLLTLQMVPPTLLDRFRERDGTIGRIAVVTARGDAQLEFGPNLQNFADAVRDVAIGEHRYDAAGENVVFADLLRNIEREGPLTTFLSMVGVCLLVIGLFRSFRASALVIGSLVTGVILMAGVAALVGIKINFFNFIVFPITFGIAVDYGANVVARVRERGGDVLLSLAEVGPAVALCSWTSMIGYGSLLFSLNRALRSFGWYAMTGEITSILCALVLLPALRLLVPARAVSQVEKRPA